MGRGRGKGKRGGRGGGGRQHFVSSLEELESRNVRDEAWAARRKAERASSGSSDDDDESESSGGEGGDEGTLAERLAASAEAFEAMGLEEKKPKPKGVASLIEIENPNAKPKGGKMMKAKDMDMAAAPAELSRREREAIEAQRKKDHYMKLHAEGKTEEAQTDMARLALVRKRREEAERRKAEEEAAVGEAAKALKEKAAKAKASKGPEKLNPIEVKKMNPTKLKELLKEREQSLQGSKKDLIARLLDWEKANQG